LSPKSTQEAFDLTIECFNLSEMFRCPVFLLSDETVGHTRELLVIPPEEELKVVRRIKPTVPPDQFVMYPLDTPDVINYPFPNIGEGYGICVSPYTHNSKGYASTAQDIQEKMAKRLTYKITKNLDKLVRVERQMMEDAEFAVIAYGGNARPAMAAVEMARERGMRVGFFRPIIAWPFPDGEVLRVAEKVKTILVCELNIDGQLAREVSRASKGKAEVYHLGSGGVEPHLPSQIFDEIRRLY
jgi:2-oxoglutarate ferredoxin oxidoreductase subunit alpha